MTTTTTKMEAFFLCQKEARGDLGKTLIADQIANAGPIGVVDDPSEFGYTLMGDHDLDGIYIWRYPLTGNDEVKRITGATPSIGRVTVESVWADQTDKNYVLIGIHPQKVIDAMDAGYGRMTTRKDVVLTIGSSDLDMERPDADYWNGTYGGSSNTNMTVAKVADEPQNKVTGKYSLRLTATAANGNRFGPAIRAVPGQTLVMAPCLRVVGGGPWTLRLWDATNSAFFGETQTYSGAEFAYLYIKNAIVPDGCDYWQLYISATDNGGIAYLDSVSARAKTQAQFMLEDWIDETYKLPFIHRVRFASSIPNQQNQYAAPNRMFAGDLTLDVEYHVQPLDTETNQRVLDFEPIVEMDDDIFYLSTYRDRYLVEPWDDKTDVTTAPRGELTAYLMNELCSLLLKETGNAFWLQMQNEWQGRLGFQAKARAEPHYQPVTQTIVVKI